MYQFRNQEWARGGVAVRYTVKFPRNSEFVRGVRVLSQPLGSREPSRNNPAAGRFSPRFQEPSLRPLRT